MWLLLCCLATGTSFGQETEVLRDKQGDHYHESACKNFNGGYLSSLADAKRRELLPCEICYPSASKPNSKASKAETAKPKEASARRCMGQTQKEEQCSRRITGAFCWQHKKEAVGLCGAITKKGLGCRNKAGKSGYCYQHEP